MVHHQGGDVHGHLQLVSLIMGLDVQVQLRAALDQLPEQLVHDQISTWTAPGDLVYDCFMGSGTTAKVAQILERQWIGSEVSAEYVRIAETRIAPYVAEKNFSAAK